jgi:hypothetical protein
MTFLESILTQFFAPSEQAAIPVLVPNEHLLAANSLYQATSMGQRSWDSPWGNPSSAHCIICSPSRGSMAVNLFCFRFATASQH